VAGRENPETSEVVVEEMPVAGQRMVRAADRNCFWVGSNTVPKVSTLPIAEGLPHPPPLHLGLHVLGTHALLGALVMGAARGLWM
jgi:hypothetical protein